MTDALAASFTGTRGALEISFSCEVDARGLVLSGPNGAGKTTTLLALAGVIRPRAGRIAIGADVLYDQERGVDVAPEARRIAYLPQDLGLFPHLSVERNVAFPFALAPKAARGDVQAKVGALLDRFGLRSLAQRAPASLSGGERQRVALARTFAMAPRALLLDEPLAALDVVARPTLRAELGEALRALGRPFVVVTHDVRDADAFGCPIAVLEAGRIVQMGDRAALAARPATEFVRRLVG